MNALLATPLSLPLLAAAYGLLRTGHRAEQRVASWVSTAGVLIAAVVLCRHVLSEGPVASQIGSFVPGVAIPLVADGWSTMLLIATGVVYLAALGFAWAAGDDDHPAFHPLVQALLAGIVLAFLTGDLFNLFVSFEVMLISSYVLCALGSGRAGRRATFTYIIVNLSASTVLLAGTAIVYGVLGTVNFAVLNGLSDQPGAIVALTLPLVAFGVKAGLVPVNGWLPLTYARISPAVAGLLAGLLTKVGVYALYRVTTLLLPDRPGIQLTIAVVAAISMVVGVLQAVGQTTVRSILSFHITSQVGYMVMGLAIGGVRGLTAGIAFTLHNIVAKSALFLTGGALERTEGTGTLGRLGGVARRNPVLAVAFGLSAAALAGLPPLSGFVPKLALVQAAFDRGWWVLGGLSLAVSALTLLSMLKIQTGVFWGSPHHLADASEPDDGPDATTDGAATVAMRTRPVTDDRRAALRLALPALALAVVTVAFGLAIGPIMDASRIAAEQLADPTGYLDAVAEAAS